jgi:cytochrome c oxidase subunit 2
MKVRGEKVYASNCAVCHQPNGKGAGAFPALDGSKVVNGPKAGQMHILLEGRGGMPSWKQLSDTELAAAMTYTRNAWGNRTGEVIQPADFVNARAGKFPEGGGAPTAGTAEAAPKAKADPAPATSPDKQASLAGNRVAG